MAIPDRRREPRGGDTGVKLAATLGRPPETWFRHTLVRLSVAEDGRPNGLDLGRQPGVRPQLARDLLVAMKDC